ncbi:acyltransferase family protein [Photobacterium sp. Alg240-V54]|uniref:acyltransferase family protein n=1 Tax=Photobacterium sp. Alg240-V54 TaxID=2305995 RepID=UPI0013D13B66|nr:acyltransferase family protein [Photobacterium sp. Alg240-V54]
MNFRQDINGLRAIAVIAVVIFHFNSTLIPGGFAGVDVFFVISGFLMTSIIFRGIGNNNFSILSFYKARAIRIIPALLALSSVTFLFCWFFLVPLKFEALGRHVLSSISFLSNITYWKESGYFDTSSQTKWLLHTWSLSVEWQFYIIYPIVLVILSKIFSLNLIKKLLVVTTILGLGLSAYASYYWPSPAYYLFPTRAWEMMAGGLVFLYPVKLNEPVKKYTNIVGFVLIICSYIFMSKADMWPGYLALIPVLGSALIIWSNKQDSLITNNKIMTTIGLWSYSIYLWHWPVVVIGHYFNIEYWTVIGIPLSILLGYMSYTFIEKNRVSLKAILLPYIIIAGISYIVISNISFFYNIPNNKFEAIVTNKAKDNNGAYTWSRLRSLNKKEQFSHDEGNKMLIIGDSQAGDFVNVMYDAGFAEKSEIISRVVEADCGFFYLTPNQQQKAFSDSPTIKDNQMWQNKCQSFIKHVDDGNVVEQANIIVLAMYWRDDNMQWILQSIENIRSKNPRAKIYVVGGKSFNRQISTLAYDAYRNNIDIGNYAVKNIAQNSKEDRAIQNKIFESKAKLINYNYTFINMTNLMCDSQKCNVIDDNGHSFYYDRRHTTRDGTKYIAKKLLENKVF